MESRRDAAHISPAFIYATFFVTGVITTLLGPLLPQLAARWSVDDLHAGYLFTSQFAGSFAGTLLSGIILPKLGFARALSLGYFFMAAGVMALEFRGMARRSRRSVLHRYRTRPHNSGHEFTFRGDESHAARFGTKHSEFHLGHRRGRHSDFRFHRWNRRSGALLICIAVVSAAISVDLPFHRLGRTRPQRARSRKNSAHLRRKPLADGRAFLDPRRNVFFLRRHRIRRRRLDRFLRAAPRFLCSYFRNSRAILFLDGTSPRPRLRPNNFPSRSRNNCCAFLFAARHSRSQHHLSRKPE